MAKPAPHLLLPACCLIVVVALALAAGVAGDAPAPTAAPTLAPAHPAATSNTGNLPQLPALAVARLVYARVRRALPFLSLPEVGGYTGPRQRITLIGAGYGRTGTDSMRVALAQAGWRPYHKKELVQRDHTSQWDRYAAVRNVPGATDEDPAVVAAADVLLDFIEAAGFNATLDFPVVFLLPHLLRRSPHAPVVLSTRATAAKWATSFLGTIARVHVASCSPPLRYLAQHGLLTFVVNSLGFADPCVLPTQAEAEASYLRWLDYVRGIVPADRLLEHTAKEGWVPLCRHLRLDGDRCPAARGQAYPHVNDGATMKKHLGMLEAVTRHWTPIAAALVVLAAVAVAGCLQCWRCVCRRGGGGGGQKQKGE